MNIKNQKVHIIGMCGIGMSAIAQHLVKNNTVQGSDATITNPMSEQLQSLGIKVTKHNPLNITSDIDFVVKSTAIKAHNPELIRAGELNIPILSRADLMHKITKESDCVISLSGAHGKTTTTTMTTELLVNLDKNPTAFSGGIMGFCNNNYKLGDRNLIVVEADESDGTFLELKTDIAILTNVEFEHAEYYRDINHLMECCEKFLNGEAVSKVIVCGDDPIIAKLDIRKAAIRYGFNPDNDIYAKDINDRQFTVVINNQQFPDFTLNAYGEHNILNALAAISAAVAKFGMSDALIATARQTFGNFKGVARRFNILRNDNITVIDDYAHHPTEIAATIAAARQLKTNSRIIAVVQPHRYTRLAALMSEFSTCTAQADVTIVSNVYAAGESPVDGVNSIALAEQMSNNGVECHHCSGKEEVFELLQRVVCEGDTIIFMGAGDITAWARFYAA